jgi:hypothetical protein
MGSLSVLRALSVQQTPRLGTSPAHQLHEIRNPVWLSEEVPDLGS